MAVVLPMMDCVLICWFWFASVVSKSGRGEGVELGQPAVLPDERTSIPHAHPPTHSLAN